MQQDPKHPIQIVKIAAKMIAMKVPVLKALTLKSRSPSSAVSNEGLA